MRGLYVIIDPEACTTDPLQVARAVLRGGCAALQRRERSCDAEVVRMATLCREHALPFSLNDRC